MKSGIYMILNIVNNKYYIGSAKTIAHRWNTHSWHLNRGSHQNKHLQSSYDVYGEYAFKFIVLEKCAPDEFKVKEQRWIDWTKSSDRSHGYNIRKAAESNLGIKRSDEAKEKQRLSMTGFRHSEASLEKMRNIQSNRSIETKTKLSKSKMGHAVSEKTKMKIGLSNKIKRMIKIKVTDLINDPILRNELWES